MKDCDRRRFKREALEAKWRGGPIRQAVGAVVLNAKAKKAATPINPNATR